MDGSRWHPLWRLVRHRWVDESALSKALPDEALERLQQQVRTSEQAHSGEIRLCIEAGLPWRYIARRASARERALSQFGRLRVWDTEHNNGVLIYLLLAERQIEVVADRGIAARVPQSTWDDVVRTLQESLRSGHVEAGLSEAIAGVGRLLAQHFPLATGQQNPNELPDRPAVGSGQE